MKVLDAPKTKKALPKYMTLEEARHLLSVVDGKYKERDYAILTLLLNCGFFSLWRTVLLEESARFSRQNA